ncbi:prepilin-type N-terminal cleavage/methylation domain-containing protein [candidate division GN15 bacterium]|nr:prepilin-type N-terminal cleavage/methylation domain-containing protein [candidate division GN15 bacterium]
MMIVRQDKGYTIIELVIVIIVIGILATVATRTLQPSIDTARYEQTKTELDHLAWAVAGNPLIYDDGARSDFGYVGDVGALPPNLDALVTNPGGFATWDGPYIDPGKDGVGFKQDAWEVAYTFTGTAVRSIGSGQTIEKVIAANNSALLANDVRGVVLNADGTIPGATYADSVRLRLLYPDGTGSIGAALTAPSEDGSFSFSGIPVGNHQLELIYVPEDDTVSYTVCVNPGRTTHLELVSPADLW